MGAGHQQYVPIEPKITKKKVSLAPGQRAKPRVEPMPKPKPQPKSSGSAAGHQPRGKPTPQPSTPKRKPCTAESPMKLPEGVEWPALPRARRVAETLFKDMQNTKQPLDSRKRAFRAACLTWHPDKSPKYVEVSTEVFKFLQTLKHW